MASLLNKPHPLQPIQELAFHKEQWEINDVHFQCHQSYYEGQLLNGVDLKIKQYAGLRSANKNYDYLQDSQQIVFFASSNLIIYNTNKRTYHQLFPVSGEVEMLRTHIEKMNNREYIIWIEDESSKMQSKQKSRLKNNSQMHKTSSFMNQDLSSRRNATLLKSIFAQNNERPILSEQTPPYRKKSAIKKGSDYRLKIFDYSRKKMVFESVINIQDNHMFKDVFFVWSHYKIVGYITQEEQSSNHYIYYQTINNEKDNNNKPTESTPFEILYTNHPLHSLTFNNQLSNYIFGQGKSLNQIIFQQKQQANNEHQMFRQFLNFTQKNDILSGNKKAKLNIDKICQFQSQVLGVCLNDQYLAVMTQYKIYFHSVFDPATTIFTYQFQSTQKTPLNLYLNKSTLMVTFRNMSSIFTYTIKNKTLKFVNEIQLQLKNGKEILQIYCNSLSSQIFCVVLFEQFLDYSMGSKLIQSLVEYALKPAYIDIATTFLSSSSKAEVSLLGLSQNRFKKIHTCPWLSSQIVQTDESITFKQWRETFQNKKCVSIHPTGLFVVVCFKQSFKIYIITFEGFVNTYRGDSIKDIQSSSISLQGNHLAISSTNNIYIYDFYSCSRIRTLSISYGATIELIQYTGYNLMCHLKNKKVYLYDSLNEYKEKYNFNPKIYHSQTSREERSSHNLQSNSTLVVNKQGIGYVFYDAILNFFIYSYGSMVYFFNCKTQAVHTVVEFQSLSYIYYNSNLSTLFLGTDNGEVICFSWPNKPVNLQNDQLKFKLHRGKIIDIKVSSDLRELITIGEDESFCKCSLFFVQNLKRYEGLQLIQYLSSNVKICYDFLSRKGIYQYTHSKFNGKADTVKDYEDEVINMNFILPEERQKQKEHMLTNVQQNIKEIAQGSNHVYKQINETTNKARDIINKQHHQLYEFESTRTREKEQLKQKLFGQYMDCYNKTQKSSKELESLKNECLKEKEQLKNRFKKQQQFFTYDCQNKYKALIKQQQALKKGIQVENKQQLMEIDQQKKQFIEKNLCSLNHIIEDINSNNGILSCKNNNLQKEIVDIKRKIQEHHELYFRLKINTQKLRTEQQKYQQIKTLNKKNVEKQDKINLTEIQKRYVKQTQKLIEKDKQINVQLVNYSKEKSILVHLQKCLEELQANIEELVENILKEKKGNKDDVLKIENVKKAYKAMMAEQVRKKKEKISTRNQINNFICQLEGTIQEIVQTRSRQHIKQLLQQKDLIFKQPLSRKQEANQDAQILTHIIDEKVINIAQIGKLGSTRIHLKNMRITHNSKSYRHLKTQGDTFCKSPPSNQTADFLSITNRQLINKKSKGIYAKLGAQKKHYQRIKTEQMVFKNTRKKLDIQNQDLIQYYNQLAIDNKKVLMSLKTQLDVGRMPKKQKSMGKEESNPTTFELYLNSKNSANRKWRVGLPSKTYQY